MTTKTVLIADDDYELVEVLAMRCRQLGLKVLAAYNGTSALSMIEEQMPDLVCLDGSMPLGNGLKVCEMMARDKALARVPVIVLTDRPADTLSGNETIHRCRSTGAHCLHKSPEVWQRLRPLLCELLGLGAPEPADSNTPGLSDGEDIFLAKVPRCLSHLIDVVTHSEPDGAR